MSEEREIVEAVRQALHSEPRVRPVDAPLHLSFARADLTIEGEVDHVAGKKLALECAARLPGVATITELLDDPALARCGIRALVKGEIEVARPPADPPARSTCGWRIGW